MEEELKCPTCRDFLTQPVLLQCSHSYCRDCVLRVLQKAPLPLSPPCSSSSASDTVSLCVSDPDQESDKLSVVSETDSGVCIYNISAAASSNSSRGSRPSSFLGLLTNTQPPTKVQSLLTPCTSGQTVVCELCQKASYFADEHSISKQAPNLALHRLIGRYRKYRAQLEHANANQPVSSGANCQWCEESEPVPKPATCYCESCGFFYCADCQPIIHPAKGPLRDHNLVPATSVNKKKLGMDSHEPVGEYPCEEHVEEVLNMFCTGCAVSVCCKCIHSGRHANHNVQSLSTTAKSRKAELSRTLQELSEKAKKASEQVNQLKRLHQLIDDNCAEFTNQVSLQIDAIMRLLDERRAKLLQFVDSERERKHKILKSQVDKCKMHLGRTHGLIQFCIELLKEPDPIDWALCNRTTDADFLWNKNINTTPNVKPDFVFDLDLSSLHYAAQTLEFVQLQAPPRPYFLASECSAENNCVDLKWDCSRNGQAVDGFSLEMDSGKDDGRFHEVYRGREPMCIVEGLHFDTIYNVRVKAFNAAGESPYSEPICLRTADRPWFQLCKSVSQNDVLISNENYSASGTSADYGVVLGTISFSKGVHYWEVSLDRLDSNTDVVLGVAQTAVDRHKILGRDMYGWAMYLDVRRTWYFHNGEHHGRIEGGAVEGSIVGVRLDCDQGRLSFHWVKGRSVTPLYVDGSPFAFQRMPHGVYFPAFSVNRGAVITIHTGLLPPSIDADLNPTEVL